MRALSGGMPGVVQYLATLDKGEYLGQYLLSPVRDQVMGQNDFANKRLKDNYDSYDLFKLSPSFTNICQYFMKTLEPIKPILTSRNMQKMIFRLRKNSFSPIFAAPVKMTLLWKIVLIFCDFLRPILT